MIPTVFMESNPKPLANTFGVYSFSLVTRSTFSFVFGLTFGLPFTTLDTVAIETPESLAISYILMALSSLSGYKKTGWSIRFFCNPTYIKYYNTNIFTGQIQNISQHCYKKCHIRFSLIPCNLQGILRFLPIRRSVHRGFF